VRVVRRDRQGDDADTVDGTIPPQWRARLDPGGTLTSARRPGAAPGFREAYLDDDPEALAAYEREMATVCRRRQIVNTAPVVAMETSPP
jgi:hypothetical protein